MKKSAYESMYVYTYGMSICQANWKKNTDYTKRWKCRDLNYFMPIY